MRKNKWNWMAALLMIVVGMSSCSSEEELEVEVDEPLSGMNYETIRDIAKILP